MVYLSYIEKNARILKVQEILKKVDNHEYEEAYVLSSRMIDRAHIMEDAYIHEWITALTDFFKKNQRERAIKNLEEILPEKMESEIHYRVLNALIAFYGMQGNREGFEQCVKKADLSRLENKELKVVMLFDLANAFFDFKDYDNSLIYTKQALVQARENGINNLSFSFLLILEIMCNYYLGHSEKAKELEKSFLVFLQVIGKLEYKKYLEDLIKAYKEEEYHV